MAITDLTNTKWKINSTTCSAGYGQFDVTGTIYDEYGNYKEPDASLSFMYIGYTMQHWEVVSQANTILVSSMPGALEVGDVVVFESGTDATNTDLITWLEANATQIPTIVEKNITMHPVVNGVHDTTTNLYPKTKLENIVDIPEKVSGAYLHVNATTGALEWASVSFEINSDLLPNVSAAYNSGYSLGSTSFKWRNIYLARMIRIYTRDNNYFDISTDYTNDGIMFSVNGNRMYYFTNEGISSNDSTRNLGASNKKWNNIYFSGGLSDGRNANYKLLMPNTTSWTANKTIANTELISDAYDSTATYAVGDLVIYNNVLYKCTTAVSTAESFDSTKWTETTIADELQASSSSGGGTTYTAGTGINISSDVISVDSSVVAMQSDLPDGDFNINFNDTTSTPTTTVALQNIFVGTTKYTVSPGMSNPMTTAGDIIYGGSNGTPTKLAKGTAGQVLTMNSGATAPEWKTINAPTYAAGTGIDITNNTIKATGVEYKNASGVAQGNALKFVKLTQTEYNNLQSVDANTLYIIYTISASGYSGDITTYQGEGGAPTATYIKFNTAPSSASDYDVYVDMHGNITGSTSYSNKSKVYVWGTSAFSRGAVTINNVETTGGSDYANAVEITLTGDYDIALKYQAGGGGND